MFVDHTVQMSTLFYSRWADESFFFWGGADESNLFLFFFYSEIDPSPHRKPRGSVNKSILPSRKSLQYTIHFPRIKVSQCIYRNVWL